MVDDDERAALIEWGDKTVQQELPQYENIVIPKTGEVGARVDRVRLSARAAVASDPPQTAVTFALRLPPTQPHSRPRPSPLLCHPSHAELYMRKRIEDRMDTSIEIHLWRRQLVVVKRFKLDFLTRDNIKVRAIAIRCFSPPDSLRPRSPACVSYPAGMPRMASWTWIALHQRVEVSLQCGTRCRYHTFTSVCTCEWATRADRRENGAKSCGTVCRT